MKFITLVLVLGLSADLAAAACNGAYKGYFEKQPLSGGDFAPIQSFTIDPSSGTIEQCEVDNSFPGDFVESGDQMQFGYARRMRSLTRVSDGTFVSPTWQAEFKGTKAIYRIRVETK